MKIPFSIFLLFLLTAPSVAANLSGELKNLPAGGQVTVYAYAYSEQRLQGETPYQTVVEKNGTFHMDVPASGYFLLARGEGLFGFYGRNPVAVPEQGLHGVVIPLVSASPPLPDYRGPVKQGVFGQVLFKEKPVSGVTINIYGDMTRGFKGMGLGLAGPTDDKGQFGLDIGPGNYYLLARKRNSGAQRGPLEAGDLYGFYADNPLQVSGDKLQKISIELVKVPEKAIAEDANLGGSTHITGRLVDDSGAPVAGVRVMLYMDPSQIRQPAMVSRPTGLDGRFELSFPAGGTYFLIARDTLGGPPAKGQLYGQYQGPRGSMIQIETGQTLGDVEIHVRELQ